MLSKLYSSSRGFPIVLAVLALATCAPGQTGTGVITTIAGGTLPGGAPVRGFSGDNGPAANALLALADLTNACDPRQPSFEQTVHIAIDSRNNVYFTDSGNQRIRKIDAAGLITTVAGTGEKPPLGAPPLCENTGGSAAIGDGGAATSARFYFPGDIALAPGGNILIADQQDNRIRQIDSSGRIGTIVGSGLHNLYAPNAPPTVSPLDWPGALALDSNGAIYFAEVHSSRVAKVANGVLLTVAGTGIPGFSGDGGKAVNAALGRTVTGLALDATGTLYIADEANHRIRKVTPDGIITTIAGTGTAGFGGDGGLATAAQLNMPADVKLDTRGNLYIADMLNNRVRRIDSSGVITTVAGDGTQGRGPDTVPATASRLNYPAAVALDAKGDLYIVDWQNYLIRKVSFGSQPVITPGAIVNAASFAPAPIPVAPGSIISILGANLADATAAASGSPLPASLGGATVQINGTNVPLFYASGTQINAQVPFETTAGAATVTVTTSAGASAAAAINIAAAGVGVFAYGGTTRAIAVNQDGSFNSPDAPAARGDVIVVYLTGQGAVTPPVPTGQAAPLDVLSYANGTAAATVGGMDAPVKFLGLAPGFIGVAQANIGIPTNAPTGSAVVLVIGIGGQSGNTTTISIK